MVLLIFIFIHIIFNNLIFANWAVSSFVFENSNSSYFIVLDNVLEVSHQSLKERNYVRQLVALKRSAQMELLGEYGPPNSVSGHVFDLPMKTEHCIYEVVLNSS